MSNFWTVQFFKNQIRTEFWLSAHPCLIFPFLQTNITSQVLPCGGKGLGYSICLIELLMQCGTFTVIKHNTNFGHQWSFTIVKHNFAVATGKGRRNFAVSSPETCNSLPAELRLSTLSTATFARRLKVHLFVSTEWHVPAAHLILLKTALFINIIIIIIIQIMDCFDLPATKKWLHGVEKLTVVCVSVSWQQLWFLWTKLNGLYHIISLKSMNNTKFR